MKYLTRVGDELLKRKLRSSAAVLIEGPKWCGKTSTGAQLAKSIVYIQDYGYYIAEDCGGDIKSNRIDIFTASHENAIQQGKKVANVWILGKI